MKKGTKYCHVIVSPEAKKFFDSIQQILESENMDPDAKIGQDKVLRTVCGAWAYLRNSHNSSLPSPGNFCYIHKMPFEDYCPICGPAREVEE